MLRKICGTIAAVTSAGSPPVDLNLPSDAAMPFGTPGPVFASWGKRVAAAVLDGAIGAGTTFLAFGDQSVTVPFIGTAFQPTGVQGVPTTSWTDSGWVISAVLLVIVMQAYLGVTPGKIVMGIAVVHERDARPIGLVRTTVRWLLHILDSILLIGYLRPLWNAQRKTFADSIMATVVLDTRRPRRHHWFAPEGDLGRPGTATLLGSAPGTPVVVRRHSDLRGGLCGWCALLLRVIGIRAPRHLLRDDGIG